MPNPITKSYPIVDEEDVAQKLPVGLQCVSKEGTILWANDAQLALVGIAAEQYVGQPCARFHADPSVATRFLEQLAAGETLKDFASALRRHDGELVDVLIDANVHRAAGEFVHTRCCIRDVTARRRRERALEERVHALSDADRQKDEFLATLSHELRTPLNAVLGWARLLRRSQLEGAKRDEAIATIERNAVAQARLVDELLDVARIASGKLAIDIRPVDLGELVGDVVDGFRPAAAARGVALEARIAAWVGPFAGDRERLRQVLANLVENALKFTPGGGRVEVELAPESGQAVLTVRDTGRGIEPGLLPRVFERFTQGRGARAAGGLGLGLAIARHIVELHGGSVVAESPGGGRGAVFRVTLPLLAAASANSAPLPPVRSAASRLDGLSIVVVEDETDSLDLLRSVLELAGARVTSARSAEEGLAFVARERPDVLVSDIGLPGIDGYAFIAAVRALPADSGGETPACALTAHARAEDRERVLAAGYQMHFAKPIDPTDLTVAIAELVRRLKVPRTPGIVGPPRA